VSTATISFGTTRDGLEQLRRCWAADAPKAAILLVHGIGEHSGRYEHVGGALAAAGYDTLGFDQRGFGKSGGLISATYLVSNRPQPDLAVLSAPALSAKIPLWQRVAIPVLSRLIPKLHVKSDFDGSVLSRDVDVQESYNNDPLRVDGSTAALGRQILDAMKATSPVITTITQPTYVLHGESDTLVPPLASEAIGELPNVTRKLWAGLRHECMNEPEWPEVIAGITEWLDGQVPT
jgi:acylglycerol lipase